MFGKFQILKSLIFPIILGIDFMQDHQVQMDYASNTVIFNNLESAQMCDEPKTTVETVCSVVIPPLSEKVIKVKIGDHYKWQTSIIEPVANLSNRRLAMARCIVSPKSNVCYV